MVTKAIRGAVTTAVLALAAAALWPAVSVRAQLPMPASTAFEMTGFIQSATLGAEKFAGDPFRGGTITVNNHKVTVPRNTIFQMPATSLTWGELFTLAPASYKALGQTGLALNDGGKLADGTAVPKPDFPFEVFVQGNRVGDDYIAALLFISPLSLQQHQGFISAIDYAQGELVVGGVRVRLNDPVGRYGRAMTHDPRLTIDEDNPTVKSETGYPMCIPRTRVDQNVDDPLCPQGNRPAGKTVFTMGTPAAPTDAERLDPSKRAVALDPWRAAPFAVGDYVTVRGPIVKDAAGQYISATAVDANVGIFTAPGTLPAYVAIDVVLMGTGPLSDVTLAQEGAKRTRVEGFTTDITAPVIVAPVDVNACTGEGLDRFPYWNVQAIDPGPPNGAVAGRWRFRPGAPLFDLKGFPFLPPTREVHVISINGAVQTMNNVSAGEYTAPNFEFILPENRGIGSPIVAGNFDAMPFLTQGSGPRTAFGSSTRLGFVGQLDPWPGDTVPARSACAPLVVINPAAAKVNSGTTITLDGSATTDANTPASPLTYSWSKSGNGTLTPMPTGNQATFTAPTLTAGAAPVTVTVTLTANNGTTTGSATSTLTVIAPADTVKPAVGSVALASGSLARKANPMTVQFTVTDPTPGSGVNPQGGSITYSYLTKDASGRTVTVTGTLTTALKSGTTNVFTATFTPSVATSYTFTPSGSDLAGNVASGTPSSITVGL